MESLCVEYRYESRYLRKVCHDNRDGTWGLRTRLRVLCSRAMLEISVGPQKRGLEC